MAYESYQIRIFALHLIFFPCILKGLKVISNAKAEEIQKGEQRRKLCLEVNDCIKQLDHYAIEVLDVYYGNHGI